LKSCNGYNMAAANVKGSSGDRANEYI